MLGQLAKSGRTSKSGTPLEFLAIDRCMASAKSIDEKTGGGVSTAAVPGRGGHVAFALCVVNRSPWWTGGFVWARRVLLTARTRVLARAADDVRRRRRGRQRQLLRAAAGRWWSVSCRIRRTGYTGGECCKIRGRQHSHTMVGVYDSHTCTILLPRAPRIAIPGLRI
jgi:hypothetical protein